MKLIIKYLKPFKIGLLLSVALLVIQATTELLLPDLMGTLVDDGIIGGAGQNYILSTGVKMLGVTILGSLASVLVGLLSARISAAVARDLRRDIFAKVSSFSSAEYNSFSTASLITRTTNDIQQVQNFILMGVRIMFYAPIIAIGGIIMATGTSPSLTRVIAIGVVVLVAVLFGIFSVAIKRFRILQTLIDKINLVSRENLTGVLVVRAFQNEKIEEERFECANNDLYKTNRFVMRITSFMMPVMMIILNMIMIGIVYVGATEIAASNLLVGDMMAFMQYGMRIVLAFLMISFVFIMLPRASVSAARIAEIINTENVIIDKDKPTKIHDLKGKLTFENVSFKYENAEGNVLEDISFTANVGETTAFIGSTGSGKSTLMNLVPRFFDVTEGRILLDDVDIRDISQQDLRQNIGYVPQKAFLFSGNIEGNVSYSSDEIDNEAVNTAIEIAKAKEFVSEISEGTKHYVAAGGKNLSGGQKQRLAIARALYKKAKIYIFDDSFSALDYKTDRELRQSLREQMSDTTMLIVAARITTIMDAEQIIVLDEGKIVGKGTHAQLIRTCTEYREIAENQLSKEELSRYE